MRAIKFRAWNKEAEVMHNWDEIGKVLHAKYFDDWIAEGGIELMQYTGLKDKNGKEIYEGDIVRAPYDDLSQAGIVNYWDCAFWLKDEDWGPQLGDYADEDLEVIGNIYENPELLK